MNITADELHEILRLFEKSEFDELRLEVGEVRVHARRSGGGGHQIGPGPEAGEAPGEGDDDSGVAASETSASANASVAATSPSVSMPLEGAVEIRASVAGTYYRSPSPTADPFVEIGTRVSSDDTVGLIEVMKLFTSVPAGVDGEVVELVQENAAVVEAGDVLMYIRPDA